MESTITSANKMHVKSLEFCRFIIVYAFVFTRLSPFVSALCASYTRSTLLLAIVSQLKTMEILSTFNELFVAFSVSEYILPCSCVVFDESMMIKKRV